MICDAAGKTKKGEIKSKEIKKSHEHVQVTVAHDSVFVSLFIINEDKNSSKPYELVISMLFKSNLSNLQSVKDNRGNIVGVKIFDNETGFILHKDKKTVLMEDKVNNTTYAMSYDEQFTGLMNLVGDDIGEPESFDENFNTLINELKRLKWKNF